MQHTKRIAIATVFGALIFVSKTLVPSPVNKMIVVVQALLLALSSLLLRRLGATYSGLIGGVLTALWNLALAPFSFVFALLFGLLVDGLFFVLNVNIPGKEVNTIRIVAAMTLATAFVGVLSYYSTTLLIELIPRNLVMEIIILVVGTASGALAGYVASVIWNRYLKNIRL
ncbi:MAG: hypothetical protein OEW62_01525 [Candidatus Bathyarchaeota archaeon]|nr:hypothetical protein [Candidatus Bathyarchaeota archaeon]